MDCSPRSQCLNQFEHIRKAIKEKRSMILQLLEGIVFREWENIQEEAIQTWYKLYQDFTRLLLEVEAVLTFIKIKAFVVINFELKFCYILNFSLLNFNENDKYAYWILFNEINVYYPEVILQQLFK